MNERFAKIMNDADSQRFAELVKRIPGYMKLVRQLLSDPNVPVGSKAMLSAGGAYAISPIDLIPGIIPVAGQLDDAYALLYGLRKCLESMPPELAQQHLASAGVSRDDIDNDISLVISIAKRIGKMVIHAGARAGATIGRAGKTTFRNARDTIRKWR